MLCLAWGNRAPRGSSAATKVVSHAIDGAAQRQQLPDSCTLSRDHAVLAPLLQDYFRRTTAGGMIVPPGSGQEEDTMTTSAPQIAIQLPDGRMASFEEMQAYGQTLQQFIFEQEAVLPQVTDTTRHNNVVEYLRLLASSYNEQLRLYKAAEAQRQREILVITLRFGGDQGWR
jgi:hypothetical protein